MPNGRGSSMAGGEGFEPSTPNLGGWCSIRTEHRESSIGGALCSPMFPCRASVSLSGVMAGNLERFSIWCSAASAVFMFSLRCILVFPPGSPAFERSAFRLMLDFSRLKAPLPATQEKVATHKNLQAPKLENQNPTKQNRTCRRENRRAQNRQ